MLFWSLGLCLRKTKGLYIMNGSLCANEHEGDNMIRRMILILALMLVILGNIAAASQVVLLNDTAEKIYTIESMTLRGDLSTDALTIKGYGQVISGDGVKVYLLGPAQDLLIYDLKVDGKATPISFDKGGYFFVADEGEFEFQADVQIRTIGQIQIYVNGPVNSLKFDLENGYSIDGDRYGLLEEYVIIQRDTKVPMLEDGAFRFSYGQKKQFYYVINLRSFGSSLGRYTIDLPNNEEVSDVDGAVKWEQKGFELILDLEGSSATVSVEGLFDSTSLQVPLAEGNHHVLVEADNEYKMSIGTNAKEIDISESPIGPMYTNSRAFLAARNKAINVAIKELTLMPSLAAAVDYATNTFAITKEGSILGQLSYAYKNTGVDYIEVDVDADPLYAGADGNAVKLTRDERLTVALPKNQWGGNFEMLYFATRAPLGLVSLIDVPIAKTDLPISSAMTRIYLPSDYFIIDTFGAKGGSDMPAFRNVLIFIILIGTLGLMLLKDKLFAVYYTMFNAGLFYFDYRLFILCLAVSGIVLIRRHLSAKSWKWALAGAGALLVIGMIVFVAIGFMSSSFSTSSKQIGSVDMDYAMAEVGEVPAPSFRSMQTVGKGDAAITVPSKVGVLPVKMQIPTMGRQITVTNYLVTAEKPLELSVLLVASWVRYVLYLAALACGFLALQTYRKQQMQEEKKNLSRR